MSHCMGETPIGRLNKNVSSCFANELSTGLQPEPATTNIFEVDHLDTSPTEIQEGRMQTVPVFSNGGSPLSGR